MLFDMKDPMTIQLGGQTHQGITSNRNTNCSQVVHKVSDAECVGYEDLEVLIDIYMYYLSIDEWQISLLIIGCSMLWTPPEVDLI